MFVLKACEGMATLLIDQLLLQGRELLVMAA